MDLHLEGKAALVTGSTSGIGFAIARELAHEGASVVINGRNEARIASAREEIAKSCKGFKPEGMAADLSTEAGVLSLFRAHAHFDILIHNLGVYESKGFSQLEDSDWQKMFHFHVVTCAKLSKFYLEGMRKRNWGRIIFIASESGVNIPAEMMHYGVSKAAQLALARGLAETTAGTGITVNAVLPGPTYSPQIEGLISDATASEKGEKKEVERLFIGALRPTSLIQRFGRAEEVASLVTFLASPLSSATNGAALRVEGGIVRSFL